MLKLTLDPFWFSQVYCDSVQRSVGEGFSVKYRCVSCVQSISCTCGTDIVSPSSPMIRCCALVTL